MMLDLIRLWVRALRWKIFVFAREHIAPKGGVNEPEVGKMMFDGVSARGTSTVYISVPPGSECVDVVATALSLAMVNVLLGQSKAAVSGAAVRTVLSWNVELTVVDDAAVEGEPLVLDPSGLRSFVDVAAKSMVPDELESEVDNEPSDDNVYHFPRQNVDADGA